MMRKPAANFSHLSSVMRQQYIDPSQLSKIMGEMEANPDEITSKVGKPGAYPRQMPQMMKQMPFGPDRMQLCTKFGGMDLCKMATHLEDQNNLAYAIFLVASLLYGIGGPATMVLAVPYISEHVSRRKTDLCLGEFGN